MARLFFGVAGWLSFFLSWCWVAHLVFGVGVLGCLWSCWVARLFLELVPPDGNPLFLITPAYTPDSTPKQHLHQHPKLHAPWHPAVNLAKCPRRRPKKHCHQSHKNAPAPSPAPQTTKTARAHPAINLAKNAAAPSQAPPAAPQTAHPNSICASTPTARPLAPSRQSRKSLSPL